MTLGWTVGDVTVGPTPGGNVTDSTDNPPSGDDGCLDNAACWGSAAAVTVVVVGVVVLLVVLQCCCGGICCCCKSSDVAPV